MGASDPRLGQSGISRPAPPNGECPEPRAPIAGSVEERAREAFERDLSLLARTVREAAASRTGWVERVRAGLVALLGFLDDEPGRGSLLLREAERRDAIGRGSRPGPAQVLSELIECGDERVERARDAATPPLGAVFPELTRELVAGGVLAVIRAQLAEADQDTRCVELVPSLMAFIVTPFFGQAAASAELAGIPSCAVGAFYERPSMGEPWAFVSARSARAGGHGRLGPGAFSRPGGFRGSPVGGSGCRLAGNREDKGAVEK